MYVYKYIIRNKQTKKKAKGNNKNINKYVIKRLNKRVIVCVKNYKWNEKRSINGLKSLKVNTKSRS